MHIIAGLYRHRKLMTPKGELTKPTASRLRESLFNICQGYIQQARFLDLFAGSGAMGFEALSRGAQSATFVDNSQEAIRCIEQNRKQLGVESQTQLLKGSVFQKLHWLNEHDQQFDIIFADPPYRTLVPEEKNMFYSEKIVRLIDEMSLLAPEGILFIEEALEAEPALTNLKNLQLKNSRRMGKTVLQQYAHSL
jgi:16S rRNA (guanine966-N2)-methyltransferase